VIFQVIGSLLITVAVILVTFALAGCAGPAVDMPFGLGSRALAPVSHEEAMMRQAIVEHEMRHPKDDADPTATGGRPRAK
jgi:hypothetical protein